MIMVAVFLIQSTINWIQNTNSKPWSAKHSDILDNFSMGFTKLVITSILRLNLSIRNTF